MAASVSSPSIEKAAAGVKSSAALDFLKRPKLLLIGGKWVLSKSGKTFETINPANEEILGLVDEGDKADVDEAVKVARKAYEEGKWCKIGPHQRARYLLKIADLIEQNADELATLESLNNGMAIGLARGMTSGAVDTFRYYARWATKIYGETNPSDPAFFNCASRSVSADRSSRRMVPSRCSRGRSRRRSPAATSRSSSLLNRRR
jgi:hypothetical protein